MINYLHIEWAISGTLAVDALGPEEKEFYDKYKPIFDVGWMAGRMARGSYAYDAAMKAARDPRANSLVTTEEGGNQAVPVGQVIRKDGTSHVYDSLHYLDDARTNPEVVRELERVWIVGSLITVGDALARRNLTLSEHNQNRLPLFELVRHLRNGVAHGNAFNIKNPKSLDKHKAHNRDACIKATVFEVKREHHGEPVLFEFIGAADVIDLLQSIECYLTRITELKPGELDSLLAWGACASARRAYGPSPLPSSSSALSRRL
jgi:hypothetical protein